MTFFFKAKLVNFFYRKFKKIKFTILVIYLEMGRKYSGRGGERGCEAILECKREPGLKKNEKHWLRVLVSKNEYYDLNSVLLQL